MNLNRIFIFFLGAVSLCGLVWFLLDLLPIVSKNPPMFALLAASVGFLVVILAGFLFFRFALRSFQQDFHALKAATPFEVNGKQTETEFALETYQNLLLQVQTQKRELARLNRQVSQRAESAELFSEHIVASLPSGLIAFDAGGKTQILNAPAREILEISNEFPPNQDFHNLLTAIPPLSERVATSLKTGAIFQREEINIAWKNGKKKRFGITVAPIQSAISAEKHGVLCLIIDLTEINELREQLALKQNLESLGEMSAGLAHEFKNSLATLQSYAQLLQRFNLDERSKLASNSLLAEVRNLSEMITSFLNFARPQNLSLAKVDLNELVARCAEELTKLAGKNRVKLEIFGDLISLQADERMLRQAILNLLRNAIEAIDEDATERKVSVAISLENESALIKITDSGSGIAEKDLHSIFIPFFSTKATGHGIGLALAHRVITHHGGSLSAENAHVGGAIFRVKLPFNFAGIQETATNFTN